MEEWSFLAPLPIAFRALHARLGTVISFPYTGALSRLLGAAEAVNGPDGEYEYEDRARGESRGDVRRVAGQEATGGFEYGGERVQAGCRLDPTRKQVQRYEDRRQEQDHEDRGAYDRPCLLGTEQHRHPSPEQGRRYVGEDGEGDQAEEVETAAYGHSSDQRDRGDERPRHGGAHERGDAVAEDDPVPVGGGEHKPLCEAVLEIPRNREPRERPAHRDGLEQCPHVLESDVARRVVEAWHIANSRQSSGEGDEEEYREE